MFDKRIERAAKFGYIPETVRKEARKQARLNAILQCVMN